MSFGLKELVIILLIALVLFGTTKIKTLGRDLGAAIKGFRSAVKDDAEVDTEAATKATVESAPETIAERPAAETEVEVPPAAQSTASGEEHPPKS